MTEWMSSDISSSTWRNFRRFPSKTTVSLHNKSRSLCRALNSEHKRLALIGFNDWGKTNNSLSPRTRCSPFYLSLSSSLDFIRNYNWNFYCVFKIYSRSFATKDEEDEEEDEKEGKLSIDTLNDLNCLIDPNILK